jgi:hypothetical protein
MRVPQPPVEGRGAASTLRHVPRLDSPDEGRVPNDNLAVSIAPFLAF